jgi:hypothetical protein
VIDVLEPDAIGVAAAGERYEAGHEQALVVPSLDQAVDRLAVGPDGGNHHFAVLVDQRPGLGGWLSSPLDGETERLPCVIYPKGDVLDSVPVLVDVRCDVAVWPQSGGENQSDLVLLQHVTGAVPRPGLGAAVGEDLVPEDAAIEVGRLLGVTDVKLDEICPVDGKGVRDLLRCRKCRGAHGFSSQKAAFYRGKLANRTPEGTPRPQAHDAT